MVAASVRMVVIAVSAGIRETKVVKRILLTSTDWSRTATEVFLE